MKKNSVTHFSIWFYSLFMSIPLAFAGAANMGVDSRDLEYGYTSNVHNPLLAIFLLGLLCLACYAFSVLRITAYLISILMILSEFASAGPKESLIISVPILLACIAGTLWESEEGVLANRRSHRSSNLRQEQDEIEDLNASLDEPTYQFRGAANENSEHAGAVHSQGASDFAGSTSDGVATSRSSQRKNTRGFVEKNDRAVHGRAEISLNNDSPALHGRNNFLKYFEANTSKHTNKYVEKFDLLGVNGDLLADIGIQTIDGFASLFRAGEKPIISASQMFSTAEDDQQLIMITLLARLGNGQVVKFGDWEISGIIKAPRGIPQIQINFTIIKNEFQIEATEPNLGNLLHLKKL